MNAPQNESERIETEVHPKFLQLCREFYKVEPERLLSAMAYEFTLNPPRELVLVNRGDSPDYRRDR